MIKKMVYTRSPKISTLARGECCGYKWKIISFGTHPCAYIFIPSKHSLYGKSNIDLPVHGGVTLTEKFKDDWCIAWDYAHAGDYYAGLPLGGKKWHTSEIIKEVHDACKYLKEVCDD